MRAVLRLRSYDGLMDATNRVDGVYVQKDDRNERTTVGKQAAELTHLDRPAMPMMEH